MEATIDNIFAHQISLLVEHLLHGNKGGHHVRRKNVRLMPVAQVPDGIPIPNKATTANRIHRRRRLGTHPLRFNLLNGLIQFGAQLVRPRIGEAALLQLLGLFLRLFDLLEQFAATGVRQVQLRVLNRKLCLAKLGVPLLHVLSELLQHVIVPVLDKFLSVRRREAGVLQDLYLLVDLHRWELRHKLHQRRVVEAGGHEFGERRAMLCRQISRGYEEDDWMRPTDRCRSSLVLRGCGGSLCRPLPLLFPMERHAHGETRAWRDTRDTRMDAP